MSIELKQAAQQAIEAIQDLRGYRPDIDKAIEALRTAIQQAEAQQPAVGERLMGQVSLPDGSAFAIASFPLPKAHWLYAPREYATGAEEPLELPTPILTHDQREAVVAAIRYAVRGATMCGREQDFDPDAMVQNAVYALCGPYARVSAENTQASVNLALAQQPATTEPVQTTPNFTQLMQILDGLNRCHSRDSKVEFLRSWIRDWTQHKVDKLTHPAPSVLDGYVLVPIEPTDEMMAEMLGPFIAPFIAINDDNRSAFIEAYPRMLTAAQAQKEHMTEIQQPTIFITLQGGVVQSITGDDVNVSIHIRDLDDIEDGADDPMPTDYHPTRVYF